VVAINHRTEDTPAEIAMLEKACAAYGAQVVVAKHWAHGGAGAEALAHAVVKLCDENSSFQFVYQDQDSLWEKVQTIARNIYGAKDISADAKIRSQIDKLQEQGYGHYPVCIAKTQYSFSTDPKLLGAPEGHTMNIREVRLAAGAEFIVMVCGDVMTMPGLPKVPSAHAIDVDDHGNIVGLF
jgi:formate--tetrahydrofolate ligase